jgi:hypothetical protein
MLSDEHLNRGVSPHLNGGLSPLPQPMASTSLAIRESRPSLTAKAARIARDAADAATLTIVLMEKRCAGLKILLLQQTASTGSSRRNRVEDRRVKQQHQHRKRVGFNQCKPEVTAQQSRDAWVTDLSELQSQKQYLGGGFKARILQAKRTAIAAYEAEQEDWENDSSMDDVTIRPWSAALEQPKIATQSFNQNRPMSGKYFRCTTNPSIRHHRDDPFKRIPSGAAGPSKFGESSMGLPYSSTRLKQTRRPKSSSSLAPASGHYNAVTISADGVEYSRIKSKGNSASGLGSRRPATAGVGVSASRKISSRPGSSPASYWRQKHGGSGGGCGVGAGGVEEKPPLEYQLQQEGGEQGGPSSPTVYMGSHPHRSQQQQRQWKQEQGGQWPDHRMKTGAPPALLH